MFGSGDGHHRRQDVWLTSGGAGGHASRKSQSRIEPADVVDVSPTPVRAAVALPHDNAGTAFVASPRVLSDLFWVGRYLERVDGRRDWRRYASRVTS